MKLIIVALLVLVSLSVMADGRGRGGGRGRGADNNGGGGRGWGGDSNEGGGRSRGGGGRGRGGGSPRTHPKCDQPLECDNDPCEGANCNRFPQAQCMHCHECKPRFFASLRDVTNQCDICKDLGDPIAMKCSENNTCPGTAQCDAEHNKCCCGDTKFNCTIPPCDSAVCPNHPGARCVNKLCGGCCCEAKFYLRRKEVTSDCGQQTADQ